MGASEYSGFTIQSTYNGGTSNDWWFLTKTDGSGNPRNAIYNGEGVVPLVLMEGGGNVGFGTTSPGAILDV